MEEEIPQEILQRVEGRTWTVFVCAEPDGEECDSGTHPNILSHKCEAVKRFHETGGAEQGPQLLAVTVERKQ